MGSRFLKVKCKCGNEQVLFSHTTFEIKCGSCNELLADPKGGHALIFGKVSKVNV